jgi:hypothetical protein
MIIAGDLNTTMKEGVLDRFSMRTETPAGPGPHLAKFALENELVEAVREMNVEALILTHITSTKEGEATGGAHLSHLLMPPDTWRQCTSAGWTEVNPLFQPADHGITYCSLNVSDFTFPEPPPEERGQDVAGDRIIATRTSRTRTPTARRDREMPHSIWIHSATPSSPPPAD